MYKMCHIAQPAEGKTHVYFHTSVNPENSLPQVIICTVYLPFYTGSMASWPLISLVYRLCELKCLPDPFLHTVQVLKTRREGGMETQVTGDREGTQLWAVMLSSDGWKIKKVQIKFSRAISVLAVDRVGKGTQHKYFSMSNSKREVKETT